MQDLVELVDIVAALEEGPSSEEFGKDAAYGPDVDWKGEYVVSNGDIVPSKGWVDILALV